MTSTPVQNKSKLSYSKKLLQQQSLLLDQSTEGTEVYENLKKRKIIILGAPGVGKSAIIMRFKDDIFKNEYLPTIQETYKKEYKFNNERVELELVDIDGQNEFTLFTSNKFSFGINAYILCYSVENTYSFNLISLINSKLSVLVGNTIPKILVANKSDLDNKRVISFQEGKVLSEKINASYIECSAKSGFNIQYLFHSTLVEINKFESNIDLSQFTCRLLLEFVMRNFNRIIMSIYIVTVLSIVSHIL